MGEWINSWRNRQVRAERGGTWVHQQWSESNAPAQRSLGKGISWEVASCCCRKASFVVDDGGLTRSYSESHLLHEPSNLGSFPDQGPGFGRCSDHSWSHGLSRVTPRVPVDLCEKPPFHSLHHVSTFFSFWETGKTMWWGLKGWWETWSYFFCLGMEGWGSCLLYSNSSPLP